MILKKGISLHSTIQQFYVVFGIRQIMFELVSLKRSVEIANMLSYFSLKVRHSYCPDIIDKCLSTSVVAAIIVSKFWHHPKCISTGGPGNIAARTSHHQ